MPGDVFHNGTHIASLENRGDIFWAFDDGERVAVRGDAKGFSEIFSWKPNENIAAKELDSGDTNFSGQEMLQLDDGIVVVGENLQPRTSLR